MCSSFNPLYTEFFHYLEVFLKLWIHTVFCVDLTILDNAPKSKNHKINYKSIVQTIGGPVKGLIYLIYFVVCRRQYSNFERSSQNAVKLK